MILMNAIQTGKKTLKEKIYAFVCIYSNGYKTDFSKISLLEYKSSACYKSYRPLYNDLEIW